MTIRRQIKGGKATRVRQTISRAADRIHMVVGDREWLFERNIVDPRRVSGFLIDHSRRSIVQHEESDLRNRMGLRGWTDVLLLGLDRTTLSRLTPTGQSRRASGLKFERFVAPQKGEGISEAWWNEAQALPLDFSVMDGTGVRRISVDRLRVGLDADLLRSPSLRFPSYAVIDVAEWLEGH